MCCWRKWIDGYLLLGISFEELCVLMNVWSDYGQPCPNCVPNCHAFAWGGTPRRTARVSRHELSLTRKMSRFAHAALRKVSQTHFWTFLYHQDVAKLHRATAYFSCAICRLFSRASSWRKSSKICITFNHSGKSGTTSVTEFYQSQLRWVCILQKSAQTMPYITSRALHLISHCTQPIKLCNWTEIGYIMKFHGVAGSDTGVAASKSKR